MEVFTAELVKALTAELQTSNRLNRELLDILRDVRDELVHLREHREQRERMPHSAAGNGAHP
jgi:predicted  nucleic acid-binding Zn-ribbon protein